MAAGLACKSPRNFHVLSIRVILILSRRSISALLATGHQHFLPRDQVRAVGSHKNRAADIRRPRGAFNIPKDGPVLFICGPHANQFLDPLLLFSEVRKEGHRRVAVLTAAKVSLSMRIKLTIRV